MENLKADLVVIGAGPGGYVGAIRGAQLGLETIVVENGQVGGVCLNWGCIPSKALIEAASTFYRLQKEIPAMGINVQAAGVDVDKLQAWKNDIVKKLTTGVKTLFKGNGVRLINGTAKLATSNAVEVETEGGPSRIEARKGIIVATGGQPIDLPMCKRNGNEIICAKEAVSLKEIPKRLAVIGGGVIGLELGTVYRKLGSEIFVIEMTPTILPGLDPDIQAACARRLRQLKIDVHTSTKATGLEPSDGAFKLLIQKEGENQSGIAVDKVLVAVGMKPKTDGLGFEALGIEINRAGFVVADERCQTNVPGIYAVGDLAGQPMLAHKASFEGEVAAEAIAGKSKRTARAQIPSAVFTDPEIGTVGKTEEQAIAAGHKVKTGKFFFAASGKAMALQETHGLVKVVADAQTGKTLGVHIAGPHASDLLGEAAMAVSLGLKVEEVGHIVHAHPTLGEVLAEGFLSVDGEAIHAVRK